MQPEWQLPEWAMILVSVDFAGKSPPPGTPIRNSAALSRSPFPSSISIFFCVLLLFLTLPVSLGLFRTRGWRFPVCSQKPSSPVPWLSTARQYG